MVDNSRSSVEQSHDDDELVNDLGQDRAVHDGKDEALSFAALLSGAESVRWGFSGKCNGSKHVHDQVNPE